MFSIPPIYELIGLALIIFTAIGFHEYAHAKLADMAGDPTPGIFGRVTLDLTKHFELWGTIMIIFTSIAGVGIGWGKPVPMDPRKMRNPRWDHFIAVIGGPLSNLVMAVIWAIFWRLGMMADVLNVSLLTQQPVSSDFMTDFLTLLFFNGALINLALMIFNLLPIGPLDGMWVLGTFLKDGVRQKWQRWNLQYGMMLFLGLVIFSQMAGGGILMQIIGPPITLLARLLLGI